MKRIYVAFIAGLVGLSSIGLVGNAQAETVVSVTQTSYNYQNQPVCSAVRMNPTIYSSLPSDPCSLGTEGSYGPDRITKNTYDGAGQLTEVDKAYASSVQYAYARYTYNANGTKASEKDANNNLTTIAYDGFDRLAAVYYPSSTTANASNASDYESYGYDANGNETSWRRRDGNTIYYSYDNLNRQTLKDLPGGSSQDVYTGYDALGRIAYKRFASTSGAGVTYAYDSLGRVSSTTDMNGRTIYLAYNQASQRTSLAFPDLQAQGYYYNVDGSMNATTTASNAVGLWFGYDANGRLGSYGRPNSANTYFGYDGVSRLTGMTQDFNGTVNDIAWTFAYNPANQIVTSGASSSAYDYKQTTTTTDNRAYDGLNRDASIASIGGYDARQNLTSEGSGGRTFTYDIENRLLTSTGGSANLTLTYDPEGRLSSYTAGSSTTTFLYDGTNLIAEYDGTGAMLTRYMHTLGTDKPWVTFSGSGVGASNATYLYANYQGSIIATADMSGNVTNLYKYGPYGEPKDSANNDSWSGTRFRYTGQIMLPEARLYYYKARVYDPMYGHFLQTDPIGSKDDLDLYGYVGGDPVNRGDPTGLQAQSQPSGTPSGCMPGTAGCLIDCKYSNCTQDQRNYQAANDNNSNSSKSGTGFFGWLSGVLTGAGFTAAATNATEQAYASMKRQGSYDECQKNPTGCVWVARFYGGGAGPSGRSWMPLAALQAVGYNKGNIRNIWGIPNANTMDRLAIGLARAQDIANPSLVTQRPALPYDGYKGGAPEYFIPEFDNVPRVINVVTDNSAP